MFFYYSLHTIEAFLNKKDLIKAIFMVPVYKKDQVSSLFSYKVVIKLEDNEFIKGI
jgi:hypothetical protein